MTPIHPAARIGHVHLKVADLGRALGFWRDLLGLEVMLRRRGAVFLSAGGYHHHLALNTWESAGGTPPADHTCLFHVALLYPDRAALAATVRRATEAGRLLEGASDHGVSEAVYLRDPDGNGVELYRDRPEAEWPRDEAGRMTMHTKRLDLAALLAEAPD